MEELAARALNTAQVKGAQYADVRVVHTVTQAITVKDGRVEGLATEESQGAGVRVIVDGAWGFASTFRLETGELERIASEAVAIAKASALVKGEKVNLGPPKVHRGGYQTPIQRDPFQIPLEEKIGLLLAADQEMRGVKGVAVTSADMFFLRKNQYFASSEGSQIQQEIIESGAGIEATAVGEDELQSRSYPESGRNHRGTAGYEFVEALDLEAHARKTAEEAVALLSAKPCPSGITDLILGSGQLALQIHESCGHPIELDRVLGTEASYAGTSFLTPEKLGNFRYGSELVNITADATTPLGLGTFGYDDEGVPAQRVPIVRAGQFVGYLTSRETAARWGKPSGGAMRASGWNRIPLIRMTNINLQPGEWNLEDLIADTEEGIYMDTNKSWSIDDRRLNFQFGTEVAYEIKEGKLGAMLKNATYTGITPQFWGSCDAVCSGEHWRMWGTPNCGKGEPVQIAHVGHGAAPARFRKVQVGVMH
ncbi:MAG: TldD/PmbA family protein [Chloroflexi bacterium]|nr:TldD/PmbA family protein [Chloroflexota bacterium]